MEGKNILADKTRKDLLSSLVLISFLLGCFSCNTKVRSQEDNSVHLLEVSEKTEEVVSSDQNYHTDSNYKYEHRTGTTGNYEYNYDVSGYDSEANEVSGNISIQNNDGTGTLLDQDGNEIDVDVEWIDNGKLKGTDVDGNEFELEVN